MLQLLPALRLLPLLLGLTVGGCAPSRSEPADDDDTASQDDDDDNSGTHVYAEPERIDFGHVPTFQFSDVESISLVNGSEDEVSILSMTLDDSTAFGLQLVPPQLPFSLAPGQLEVASVYFSPPEQSEFEGWLDFETDDPDSPTVRVELVGCSIPGCDAD